MDELDFLNRQLRGQYENQSQLGEEESERQTRLVAPQIRDQVIEAQAAIIAQTNPAKAIKSILESFRGNTINEYGKLEKLGIPLMSENGVGRIGSILLTIVNDPNRFGKLSNKEVRRFALAITNKFTDDLGVYWRDYGITDPTMRDVIRVNFATIILILLTRSEEGDDKRFLSRVILETLGVKTQPKKEDSGGWLSKLKL